MTRGDDASLWGYWWRRRESNPELGAHRQQAGFEFQSCGSRFSGISAVSRRELQIVLQCKLRAIYEPVSSHMRSTLESLKRKRPPFGGREVVEAAGQPFRFFRGGLDYAFIPCGMRSVLSALGGS